MKARVEIEEIQVVLSLPVDVYEDLLAGARVIDTDIDFFVEALITCYARDFVKHMLKER